jgi:hypothetical protein
MASQKTRLGHIKEVKQEIIKPFVLRSKNYCSKSYLLKYFDPGRAFLDNLML